MRRIAALARCLALTAGVLLLSFVMPGDPCSGDEPAWKVGLARVEVTPPGPIRMAGYASRTQPSEGVLAGLWAKAMALEDAEGNRGLILTVDLISFRAPMAEELCRRIGEKTGLKRRQILLCPSHTHAGPVFGIREPERYGTTDEQLRVVREYTEGLLSKLPEAAAAAVADLRPATLRWGKGTAGFVMNRRRPTEQGIRMTAHPEGYVDRDVPLLRVDSPDGQLRAVVFGCACHPTTCTGKNRMISGDYAGFAQAEVEKAYPGVQAMFVLGCGGDANPYPRGTAELAQQHGRALGEEVGRALGTELTPIRGPLWTGLGWADLPLRPVPPREELQRMAKGPVWTRYNAERMLRQLDRGEEPLAKYHAPFAVWQLGDDLTLVGLSGETLGGYVPLVGEALGPERLWVAGYTNDVFGYLPTAKVLAEGGYETRGLIPEIGWFTPKAEDAVIAAVRELAEAADRNAP